MPKARLPGPAVGKEVVSGADTRHNTRGGAVPLIFDITKVSLLKSERFTIVLQTLLVFVLLLNTGLVRAAEPLEQILSRLGIIYLLQDVPDVLANSIEQKQKETGQLTPKQAKDLQRRYRRHYQPEALLRDIVTKVKSGVSEAEIAQVETLLNSAEGRKLVKLRKAATAKQALDEIRALAGRHKEEALSPERQQLLEALDSAAADTEFFIATQALAIYGIMHGFRQLGLQQQDTDNVDAMLNMIYQQLHRPSRYTVFLTLRYTFREVSDKELMDFVQIYRFAPLQKLLRVSMTAMTDVLLDRGKQVAKQLKKATPASG